MDISVIIPTWQEGKYLERTLFNIFEQTNLPDEVIIVDNLSTDDTVEIAKKYPISIIQAKTNIPQAKNLGARSSKGDILVFIDADTRIPPDMFENIMLTAGSKKRMSLLYLKHRAPRGASPIDRFIVTLIYNLIPKITLFLRHPVVIGDCMIVPRWAFEKVGGFDEDFHIAEDLNLSKRLMHEGEIVLDIGSSIEVNMRRFLTNYPMILLEWFLAYVYYLIHKKARPCDYLPVR